MLKKLYTLFTKKKIKVTDLHQQSVTQQNTQFNLGLYQTIEDLPVWNFRQVLNKNDLRYLYVLDTYFKLPEEYPDYEIWNNIFWDYLDKKGISSNFKIILELKAKLAMLESESIFEDVKNHTKIEITKIKIKEHQKLTVKNSDLDNDGILAKFMGFPIDIKKTTVSQYISYEKLLIQANEQQTKLNGSNKR